MRRLFGADSLTLGQSETPVGRRRPAATFSCGAESMRRLFGAELMRH
jgi:hypothetical protein